MGRSSPPHARLGLLFLGERVGGLRVLLLPHLSAWHVVPCLAHALARGHEEEETCAMMAHALARGLAGKDTQVNRYTSPGLLPRQCHGRGSSEDVLRAPGLVEGGSLHVVGMSMTRVEDACVV